MGPLVIIGGREEHDGQADCLREFVRLAGGDRARLVVLGTASQDAAAAARYRSLFHGWGVAHVSQLPVASRQEADEPTVAARLADATGVFFTGGDQLRITSILGGTRLENALKEAWHGGAVVAGTSAGASMMTSTMILGGEDEDAPRRSTVHMSPGMGFLPGVVVDQHFAQRGRIGRLLSAVAQNPQVLGVGLDEDTAMVVAGSSARIVGSGTATFVDGRFLLWTNISESAAQAPLALAGVHLHALPAPYGYDLAGRQPLEPDAEARRAREPAPVR